VPNDDIPVPPFATETGVDNDRVTAPLDPPPVKPVPAVTLSISPGRETDPPSDTADPFMVVL